MLLLACFCAFFLSQLPRLGLRLSPERGVDGVYVIPYKDFMECFTSEFRLGEVDHLPIWRHQRQADHINESEQT